MKNCIVADEEVFVNMQVLFLLHVPKIPNLEEEMQGMNAKIIPKNNIYIYIYKGISYLNYFLKFYVYKIVSCIVLVFY